MLRYIIFSTVLFHGICEERDFGEFRAVLEAVNHPLPKNDIVDYRFTLSKVNKYEQQLSAKFDFHRKVYDLKMKSALFKKSKKVHSAEYSVLYPPAIKSFCFYKTAVFPVFQSRLEPPIDDADCSLEEGYHILNPYNIEDELRVLVAGNKTFYGSFKAVLIIVEGKGKNETNPILGVEIFYTLKDANANSTTTISSQKSKSPRKNKEKKSET